ncbi:hypothetical protein [Paenibacillus dendritiformis]|uniref:hypothetical protein n=1 Tax=Paenibacillus dendritiformis TaxID=130049 RepID=UPI000DA9D281|nr:hypothetical protein [Paenibacillus dendritiformis]PZM64850.1 hypothetical protein DOE73_14925 [Paenibacillus dendritiformis]
MSEETKQSTLFYTVESPLRHNGKKLGRDRFRQDLIELTKDEAAPLLALGAISLHQMVQLPSGKMIDQSSGEQVVVEPEGGKQVEPPKGDNQPEGEKQDDPKGDKSSTKAKAGGKNAAAEDKAEK